MRKLLFYTLLATLPTWASATTTSGPTTRNVLIDGIVNTGAAPGTNGVDWETDEVFQGFSNIVNWYLTWDDQNLYLGRIGGNNSEGSVLYVRAEYTGFQTTNRGFNYDFLEPELSPMGGINFATYIKDSYSEFRTWSGGVWGAANNSIAPQFSTQGSAAHMEVAIPWNAITNSNGLPSNLRLVIYQITPNAGAPACTPNNHFVYGESPWGTGLVNDGPSVGVNDGLPFSARQPGGCGVGQDTATRWWGCYPVIGGVGSNGWTALAPNAGPDDSLCASATSQLLQGNSPAAEAVGTWYVVSQPAGASVSFLPTTPGIALGINDPAALLQDITQLGTYTLVWDINYGGCPSVGDTVVITRVALPPSANAGANQDLACDVFAGTLTGGGFGPYGGGWTQLSGQGAITNPDSNTTTVSSLGSGANIFLYTVNGGSACPSTTDSVIITTYPAPSANAGADQEHCASSITTLTATAPLFGLGQWSQFSGPSSVIFTDPSNPITTLSNLETGTYQLIWATLNGTCPPARDTMTILVHAPPIADAGPDLSYCTLIVDQLDANDPAGLGVNASGFWQQASGPTSVTFADSTAYNTAVSGFAPGMYKLRWTLSNGNCPVSVDIVTIIISTLTNNGLDSLRSPSSGNFNGYVEVAHPTNGEPPIRFSIDGGPYQLDSTFDNLGPGTYTVNIIDNFGCADSLMFTLTNYNPPPPPDPDTLFIPDGFSPNADGTNDTWEILGIAKFPDAVIEVYNIWGSLIFASEGAYTPWNGQYQAQDMPQANYYYIVDLKSAAHPVYRGSVTLFR